MTNKELFIKNYNAFLDLNLAIDTLDNIGIDLEESVFASAFYVAFESLMSFILTEKGNTYLFEDILFQGYSTEEAVDELQEYFITL